MLDRKQINCDLCVVGGGMAGIAAAVSAAREGIKVVLMHERAVLGGNASSEIRMWICGAAGEDNRETGIMEEIALENLYRNPTKNFPIWDTVLFEFVKREKNITLLLNCTCMDAKTDKGSFPHGRDTKIKSVTGYQMTTQRFYEVNAKYFCDSSGDSILAPLCGAEFKIGREAKDVYGEDTAVSESDNMTMGMSCLLQGRETTQKVKYIPPEFAKTIDKNAFENRKPGLWSDYENYWYLELGGNRDSIGDTEEIRDELVALATATWDYIKNHSDYDADNWDLDFLSLLPGKRESRRMVGEYILTQRDVCDGVVFSDEVAYGGWPIDDHYPGGFYHKGTPNTDIHTPAPYSLPYRSLYSKNVDNLFFAGRNISASHMALSSTRVMATCLLFGEAVGKAASIAAKKDITPHDVYLREIDTLQKLLLDEDCFLPSKTRMVSDVCKNAKLTGADDVVRNGQDRAHRIYNTDENNSSCYVAEKATYTFDGAKVGEVHIVFDSDLNRKSLDVSPCERLHSMRANQRIDSPQLHMPLILCKDFVLYGEKDGERIELLSVNNNRKRSYHIKVEKELDTITLVPENNWGNEKGATVISFDFN